MVLSLRRWKGRQHQSLSCVSARSSLQWTGPCPILLTAAFARQDAHLFGGIHVEILADVGFRITPLTDRDAAEMVCSIRGFRLLQGYRGRPAADLEAIEETLLRVSRLVEEVPEISELDMNPLFALPPGSGCQAVDARIQVRPDSV
jgi:acyl-CoA synthetase (NDP forming)